MKRLSLEERFWLKVFKTDSCWIWKAQIDANGYGRFQLYNLAQMAHRVAYALKNGPIEDTFVLSHSCRHKSCVNPEHLIPIEGLARVGHTRITHCPRGHPSQQILLISKNSSGNAVRCKQCKTENRNI